MINFFVYMLEILMIEITNIMEGLSDLVQEKAEEIITYLDGVMGEDNNEPVNSGPDNYQPDNSGPDNNQPDNSGPDNNDPDKDSSEGDDKSQKLDKGKGKAMDTNPDNLPEEGLSKTDPFTESQLKEAEEEHNYQLTRLAKIQGELEGKVGESSTGGLLAEQLAKYGQVVEPSSEGVQEPNPLLDEYNKTKNTYFESVRLFNDINELLNESTDLDEIQRAELLAESERLRHLADSAADHARVLESLVDIPSDQEGDDSEEEYSGEDYGSEENSGKESSDEDSRPSKRPRN